MNVKTNIIYLRSVLLLLLMMVAGKGDVWAETTSATVLMTYVDYNNPNTAYGVITGDDVAEAGYNVVNDGYVGFGNTRWNVNYITYLQVDASSVEAGEITRVTLSFKGSGSAASPKNRASVYGAGYNNSTWSSTMTYNTADKSITPVGFTYTTTSARYDSFEDVTLDITEAFLEDGDKKATIIVYETAADHSYIKNPVVTVEYTPYYNYTVQSSLGTAIQTGSQLKGSTISYHYPEFELNAGKLYQAAKQVDNPWYGKSFSLTTNNQTETVSYSEAVSDVVYYKEAENITGANVQSGSNADIRCSGGKGAAFTNDTKMTTLPAGYYKVWGQVWGNAATTFNIAAPQNVAGNIVFQNVWTQATTGSLTEREASFQMESGDVLIRAGGDKNHMLDAVYIKALFAFKTGGSEVGKGATHTYDSGDIYGHDGTVTYEIRNADNTQVHTGPNHVATVNPTTGEVTGVHNGTAILRAKKTIDAEYHTDHLITVTGGSWASSTWSPETPGANDAETFTFTGAGEGLHSTTSKSGRIEVEFGNAAEARTVETVVGKYALYAFDGNGYSHTLASFGIPSMGTYYVLKPTTSGSIKIHGLMSDNDSIRLVDATGKVLERIAVDDADINVWKDYSFNTLLVGGNTYYIYARTGWMGSDEIKKTPTLYLNSLTFTPMEGTTISLIDQSLLFTAETNANRNQLDRTIPGFKLTFGGGDGVKYTGGGFFVVRNAEASSESQNGQFTITPRIADADKNDVTFTSVTLNTGAKPSGVGDNPGIYIYKENNALVFNNKTVAHAQNNTYDLTGQDIHELTIKLKGEASAKTLGFHLNSITFKYTVTGGKSLDTSKGEVELKLANENFLYGYEGKTVDDDLYFKSPIAFDGDISVTPADADGNTGLVKVLDVLDSKGKGNALIHFGTNVQKYASGVNEGKVESFDDYKINVKRGVYEFTAAFAETPYFKAATAKTRVYSRDYEETPEKVLNKDESYTVPVGAGLFFALTATSASGTEIIELTNVVNTSATANGERFLTTAVSDGSVTITNRGDQPITITKIEVYRKQGILNIDYAGQGMDGNVFFFGQNYTPSFTITGEDGISDKYKATGTYSITKSLSGVTLPVASTGTLNVSEDADQGYVDVTLTVEPLDGQEKDYAPISKTIRLYVIEGMWDFREYKSWHHRLLFGSAGWYGGYTEYNQLRDTEDFEYFIQNDGEPLILTLGLESRYKMRMTWAKNNGDGRLHLFGQGSNEQNKARYGHGGILRVPVQKGMLVEINAYSNGNYSEMDLEGLNDEKNVALVNHFEVHENATSQFFIANRDGYFDIIDPSYNLDLYINYIKVSAKMVFRYGEETFISPRGTPGNPDTFENPIVNKGDGGTTFTFTKTASAPADLVTSINAEGVATLRSAAEGYYTVNVDGAGSGLLAGKSASYTAHVVTMTTTSVTTMVSTSSQTFDLKDRVSISLGAGETITNEYAKSKVTFSLDKNDEYLRGVSTIDENGVLTVVGAAYLTVTATLGTISKDFNVIINGAGIVDKSPVVYSNATSYTVKTIGDFWGDPYKVTDFSFDKARMLAGIKGDLTGVTLEGPVWQNNNYELKINLPGNGKGGIVPIYIQYKHQATGDVVYRDSAVLTVAYQEKVWDFDKNLIGELSDWWPSSSRLIASKTGDWETTATFDEPTDDDDPNATTPGGHTDTHDWKFVRKMGRTHPESSIIYYYNHSVAGINALVIPSTEGLKISSTKSGKQMGVEMMSTRKVRDGYERGYAEANTPYDCRNLMLLRGGRFVVPKVKPGQWIEVRWTRHQEDMAERLTMENLCDVEGKYISEIYKIGNCFYNLPWSTSTYMFQVAPEGTDKGDGTTVTLDEDGCVDAVFEVADNIYISIQQIELHEPGWNYLSSMVTQLNGYVGAAPVEPEDGWTLDKDPLTDAPKLALHYVLDGENSLTLLPKQLQNAPNAPHEWNFEADPTFEDADLEFDKDLSNGAKLTYKNGWGKVRVTLTSYSQNLKYVANHKQWVITFGQAPRQTYPYTWDFTKYYETTADYIGAYNTWSRDVKTHSILYNNYNTNIYASYYVEGAQLPSYNLWKKKGNGLLPETDGLGFVLNADDNDESDASTKDNDATLALKMENTVADAGVRASAGNTWRADGYLSIGAGGKIIVPKPGASYDDYYIYIRCSTEPSAVTNTLKITSENATANSTYYDVAEDVDDDGTDQYKYRFTDNENAELTFSADTKVYAIGVTNIFKQMTPIGDKAWATESRRRPIDHALTGYLTTNPTGAYASIESATNPTYTSNGKIANIKINDRRYVVPAKNGVILKQTTSLLNNTGYSVPLFVPAVTTAEDGAADFTGNMLMANLEERTLTQEKETGVLDDDEDAIDDTGSFSGDYTRFILSKTYMTWTQVDDAAATPDAGNHAGADAAFYRLHIYGDGKDVMAANKAYLLLPTNKVPKALWDDTSAPAPRRYVGIVGESEVTGIEDHWVDDTQPADEKLFNLNGQQLNPDRPLSPGVYIRGGKKVLIK